MLFFNKELIVIVVHINCDMLKTIYLKSDLYQLIHIHYLKFQDGGKRCTLLYLKHV